MCRWGFYTKMHLIRPKFKNKRKRQRRRKKVAGRLDAQGVMRRGVDACSERVIEWSQENKIQQTPAERRYGQILQEMDARHMFKCQQPLFGFIIDFYAPKLMLAVEIDGGYHDNADQAKYDIERTAKLNSKGIVVLRFKNEEVMSDSRKVMFLTQEKIKSCCKVNKIKKRWRHRNRHSETRDIGYKANPVDHTFPKDAYEVRRRPVAEPNKVIVLRKRDGTELRKTA